MYIIINETMNILNKIKSKQTKETKPNEQIQRADNKIAVNSSQINEVENKKREDRIEPLVSEQAKKQQPKSLHKLLNKVKEQDRKSKQQNFEVREQRNRKQQEIGINKSMSNNSNNNNSVNQGNNIIINPIVGKLSAVSSKNTNQDQSKRKGCSLGNQKSQDNLESRLSDFSDEALTISADSFSKIQKLDKKFNWMHPSLKKLHDIKNQPQPASQIPQPTKFQPPPKQSYSHIMHIKKGYQIGRMCIFEGTFEQKKIQENLKLQIRTRGGNLKKLSCKLELINSPQSIALIYLKNMIEVGDGEYLVGGDGIVGVLEKPGNTK